MTKTDMKSLEETFTCASKVIDHINKYTKNCEECHQDDESNDKCSSVTESSIDKSHRDIVLKAGLFGLCSVGLGRQLCNVFDKCKDEEKRLGRELTRYEVRDIIKEVMERQGIFPLEHNSLNSTQYQMIMKIRQ